MKLLDKFQELSGVYILRCKINNKYYVGETLNMKQRIQHHLRGRKQVIHKALLIHGIDNFDIYVEYFPNFDRETLLFLEEQLIKKFNSVAPNGYNIRPKGLGRWKGCCSTETRKKISASQTGRKASLKTKEKMSQTRSGKPANKNTTNALIASRVKIVYQLDPSNHSILKEWASVAEATNYFANHRDGANICNVIKGKRKLAFGFEWKYKT